MTPPPAPPPQPVPDDDLDVWLDELAGRRPTTDPVLRALRRAIVQRHADSADPATDATASAEAARGDALQQQATRTATETAMPQAQSDAAAVPQAPDAARSPPATAADFGPPAAGTPPTADTPTSAPPRSRSAANDRRWQLVASLAALAVVGGLVWQQRDRNDAAGDFVIAASGAPVWRDAGTLPPTLAVGKPDDAARALARQIAPLDTRPALYRDGSTVLVDFDVQPDQMAALLLAITDPRVKAVVKPGINRIAFSQAR